MREIKYGKGLTATNHSTKPSRQVNYWQFSPIWVGRNYCLLGMVGVCYYMVSYSFWLNILKLHQLNDPEMKGQQHRTTISQSTATTQEQGKATKTPIFFKTGKEIMAIFHFENLTRGNYISFFDSRKLHFLFWLAEITFFFLLVSFSSSHFLPCSHYLSLFLLCG